MVLIHEDGIKRNKWKLGRIETIIPGNDGVIRGAKIRTAQVLNKSVNNLLYNLSDACAFAYAHACTYSRIFCMVLVRYKLTRRKVRLQWYA